MGDQISRKSTLMSEDWSRDSVLGIVIRLWVGGPGFYSRQAFSVHKIFNIGGGAYLDFFSIGKAARLTTHLRLMLTLRKRSYASVPSCSFMACRG